MRILLGQNSLYYPAHGGGDKSNRLLMEALAARGHECRVVARLSTFGEAEQARYLEELAARGVTPRATGAGLVTFDRQGVDARVVTNANLRACFAAQIGDFRPDVILASTDDPAQVLLEAALAEQRARVVYLARATLALPFGPDCAFPSESKTERIRACDAAVGVSEYVARYMRRHGGIDAVHVPISLVEPDDWPEIGSFDNEFVTLVNPCAVKGLAIFLALADLFPHVQFAAVPTWGTTPEDRTALATRPNVHVLNPVDDINLLMARTRVLLVPSLWAEARSRIILEAMLRGVPVIAANVGGIPEAKMGVPYLLPVRPIERYEARVDAQMVPVADVPPQDAGPWIEALAQLTTDRARFEEIAQQSRRAALEYAKELHAGHFEELLEDVVVREKAVGQAFSLSRSSGVEELSPEKRKLIALRLRKRATSATWFPGADAIEGRRLFWFPHAGGGQAPGLSRIGGVGVRLPGRESRLAEAPFERMAPLIAALADAIDPYVGGPYAFFGHSMGAVVAFELARELRRRGKPLPAILIASAARAPQFRRNHVPPPAPSRERLIEELRSLEGIPSEVLDDPAVLRAILPALEADTELYRNYVYSEDAPFAFPIRAYAGADDPNIRREHLEGWREQTTGPFAVHVFPGGHFYLNTARAEFLAALEEDLC
jgi:surfactin synthase thioesterase subunit/glycosyltransferase involved in cell wall biosynthesis